MQVEKLLLFLNLGISINKKYKNHSFSINKMYKIEKIKNFLDCDKCNKLLIEAYIYIFIYVWYTFFFQLNLNEMNFGLVIPVKHIYS